ncbi:PstS family phosphate ABC transporter substrate-binding protein [Halocalculus aciditolerans]|uniref:Phosphate ABC transporter substrate-binding protein n=1 Tax=Halocalculus aciditolerans TaxID=1383812 RepID=A0A830FCY0_9EURY|nr:substrate-binding domain-containing protein [Halocalculus aciditolerans]GGL62682.1 phosphate ABC transporter substrate-binding protein [Halocalculus aciditolerans]
MSKQFQRFGEKISRRKALGAVGATGVAAFAGCSSNSGGSGGGNNNGGTGTTQQTTQQTTSQEVTALTAGGSSTVYPITSKASSVWNYNPPASDTEYWPAAEYGIDTDKAFAQYWAEMYGFEADGEGNPPFKVQVGLSHSGVGLTKVMKGQVDIGDASAPVEAELEDVDYDKFVNHVVGVDAQPIVVSKYLYDNGIKGLDAETVRAIYKGDIDNWSEVDGYTGKDMEIQAIGRSVGSGTDTSFRVNMLGSSDAEMPGVDIRKGENQQVAAAVEGSDNAIAYMALAFVSDQVPAISLTFDGKTYTPGENLSDQGYPLSRDLHCYTYDGTSNKEAAFLRMIIHDFGQGQYVGPSGYAQLSDARQEEELSKLPDPQ